MLIHQEQPHDNYIEYATNAHKSTNTIFNNFIEIEYHLIEIKSREENNVRDSYAKDNRRSRFILSSTQTLISLASWIEFENSQIYDFQNF